MTESIRLVEYQPQFLPLSAEDVALLEAKHGKRLSIGPRLPDGSVEISTNSYVGIIELPSRRTLYCEPKMPVRNLFPMMSWAWGLKQDLDEELTSLDRLEDLIDFVILQFAVMVEARIRRGLFRSYLEVRENLSAVRGRIDFGMHLRDNLILRHRTACVYSDFTYDIPENQIIRQVVHRLARWVTRAELRVRLDAIDARLGEVSPTSLPVSALDRMHYHRLNDDYEPIHRLCRLFLEGASVDEDAGQFDFNAFLMDMNSLFERFVLAILRANSFGLRRVTGQAMSSLDQAKSVTIKPDIRLQVGGHPVLIADTKYKAPAGHLPSNEDLYQMLAYCTVEGVPHGMLIYPAHAAPLLTAPILIRYSPVAIDVLSIDLAVPYEQFDENCRRFAARCWAKAERFEQSPRLIA